MQTDGEENDADETESTLPATDAELGRDGDGRCELGRWTREMGAARQRGSLGAGRGRWALDEVRGARDREGDAER